MVAIKDWIIAAGNATWTLPKSGALTANDVAGADCLVTCESLSKSPALLHFSLTEDREVSKCTIRMDSLNDLDEVETKCQFLTNKIFCSFGEYPRDITLDFREYMGKTSTVCGNVRITTTWVKNYSIPYENVNMEYELYLRVTKLYFRVDGYDLGCVKETQKIVEMIPELAPSINMLQVRGRPNIFSYKDLLDNGADRKQVRLASVYDIENMDTPGGKQKVYHFELDTTLRTTEYMPTVLKNSPLVKLNKEIIDFVRPYFWIMRKVHGEEDMHKSPVVKFARVVAKYAQRTGNYRRARWIIFIAANIFKIMIAVTVTASLTTLFVCWVKSDFKKYGLEGDTLSKFFWNWQDRIDRPRLRELGWDPTKYYIHRWTETWGNIKYYYEEVRRRPGL